jgi:uncharacterized protein (DUF2141 family)
METHSICAYCLLFSSLTLATTQQPKGKLSITMNSAANDKGNIEIHLLAKKAQFDSEIPAFLICRKAVQNKKVHCNFNDVPYGEYVIFSFHDANSNRDLNVDFFDTPTERHAISGIDLRYNSEPSFEQSSFSFSSQHG